MKKTFKPRYKKYKCTFTFSIMKPCALICNYVYCTYICDNLQFAFNFDWFFLEKDCIHLLDFEFTDGFVICNKVSLFLLHYTLRSTPAGKIKKRNKLHYYSLMCKHANLLLIASTIISCVREIEMRILLFPDKSLSVDRWIIGWPGKYFIRKLLNISVVIVKLQQKFNKNARI